MKRRDFLQTASLIAGGIALSPMLISCGKSERKLKFGISTDIHNDIMHDAKERISKYLKRCEDEKLDFIVDMGDFCNPVEANRDFLNIWKSSPLKKYHVIGNHDVDWATKDQYMEFVGMPKRYYSFDEGDFHFIVLDPNNLYTDGKYVPYAKANYYVASEKRAFIDPEQIEWLKNDLNNTKKYCVVFSHQSFENKTACKNAHLIRSIFENENKKAGFTKVIAAFSGHDHTNYAKDINGIKYIQINSMSNQWVGGKYACPERFSEEINKKKPSLKYTTPFKDPLYAIVTIENGVMRIDGEESSYIKPGPKELGIPSNLHGVPSAAKISDRDIRFKK